MPKFPLSTIAWPTALVAASAGSATLALAGVTSPANAASSGACEGGGFSLVNKAAGAVVAAGEVDAAIGAARFGTGAFTVRGRYITFDVRLRDFAVLNY